MDPDPGAGTDTAHLLEDGELLESRNGRSRVSLTRTARDDLAMTWLLAGLTAGLLSGAVSWAISLVYQSVGNVSGLMNELTTFAAFTALLVFLPAILGVAIGRWVTDRNAPPIVRIRTPTTTSTAGAIPMCSRPYGTTARPVRFRWQPRRIRRPRGVAFRSRAH